MHIKVTLYIDILLLVLSLIVAGWILESRNPRQMTMPNKLTWKLMKSISMKWIDLKANTTSALKKSEY